MDGKSKIPIGEPGNPEAATSHMRKALATASIELEATDHDYHVGNLTPSVNLICDIPQEASDPFYAGQIYVGLKNSIFQASDPFRHAVELIDVLRNYYQDNNIKHLFAQCALLALFKVCNFDILNVGRCVPYHSFINPAERYMSLLNIGLQGLALERDKACPFESTVKSCSTMKSIRRKATECQGLKEAYTSSIEAPIQKVESSFSMLDLKGKQVKIFKTNRDCTEIINTLSVIEPTIKPEEDIPHAMSEVAKYQQLKDYLEKHMTDGLYMLQFRKCDDMSCCTKLNDILPPQVPAPVLGSSKQKYLKFEDTYGKITTTEKDCPSLNTKNTTKNETPGFKYIASRVVATKNCSLCFKTRCIFSHSSKLNVKDERILEDILFSCSMVISSDNLYASRSVKRVSKIEQAYYSWKSVSDLICVHCGSIEIDKVSSKEKTNEYTTVYPACQICKENDKEKICIGTEKKQIQSQRNAIGAVNFEIISSENQKADHKKLQTRINFHSLTIENEEVVNAFKRKSDNEDTVKETEAKKLRKEEQSVYFETDADEVNELCSICNNDHPPGKARKIKWIDCDFCNK